MGLKNIKKVIDKEALIKKAHPEELMAYLWFIGVDPQYQGNGIGSSLLKHIVELSDQNNRPVYLETSTLKNLPWYQKYDFQIYHEEDLSYHLYFLRKRY